MRVNSLIFELWHYVTKIMFRALSTINDSFRILYLKQQASIWARLIVSIEEEHSIRQSGVRGQRRNDRPIDEFESIGEEA